ncbi:MAG: twin-arginine translocase TatA/TatE family subunit [Dehalococcoidales bacterium]|nr:twin-arginine translocase TatA/TatE family subunit [Dehalococcoidales bacterium]
MKPGPLEIGLILVIILIVFGVGKLPQVGAALGKSMNAFKKGTRGEDEEAVAELDKTKKKQKKKTAKSNKPKPEVEPIESPRGEA